MNCIATLFFTVLICHVSAFYIFAEDTITEKEQEDRAKFFAFKVLPIIKTKCFACHGEDPQGDLRGEFDMRTRATLLKGGESEEAALVPGNPQESPLFLAISYDDSYSAMPPKENDRLTAEQVAVIKKWIEEGAHWPKILPELDPTDTKWHVEDGVTVETSGGLSDDWTNRRYTPEDLWAYQPRKEVKVPWKSLSGSTTANQSQNPIDAFIYRGYQTKKIQPAPAADKRTLIRRLSYDLLGLPPTSAEVERFVNDESPQAYEKLVDRLLASPHYGERQAQHYLDVVRYADSAGFANDFERPHAWRYRDYVIRSFNQDKPYDQFVTEQIAGDELYEKGDKNPELLIATGFLRMGPWEHTGMSVAAVTRQQYLDDVLNGVGQTFLAHNTTCFKCHDHKFDPLPTQDYYRMQAIFAPVQLVNRVVPFQEYENTQLLEEEKPITDARLKDTKANIGKIKASFDKLKAKATNEQELAELKTALEDEAKGISKINKKRNDSLNKEKVRYKPWVMSVYNGSLKVVSNRQTMLMPKQRGDKAQVINVLAGGAIEAPKEEVSPGLLSVIAGISGTDNPLEAASITPSLNKRRTDFSKWLTSPDHPLTARVYVNRLWQQHFGRGIAGNSNNFGSMGKKPTHPELLDFLANYFVRNNWSTKAIHKLIVMSKTYRLASQHPSQAELNEIDPDNQLWTHFEPRRLTAEELRDSMLFTSGELNTVLGGAPARPEINMEVAMQPRHVMGSVAPAYQPNIRPDQRNRRTIYTVKIRTLRDPLLEVFDQPTPELSCEQRDQSTVTPQVFSLFNGQNTHDRSMALAASIAKGQSDLNNQIQQVFSRIYGRKPSKQELQFALSHVKKMKKQHQANPPVKVEPPTSIDREMVEEMTGLKFAWTEKLDIFSQYQSDLKPWQVDAQTRALAELCLVLFNSNEFAYVY